MLWSFSHMLLKLTRTWRWEDYNVMYIPSASLGQLGEAVNGGQRIALSPMQGPEDGWETKPRYDIFDRNTAARSAHLFQVNSVLHTIIFLRKKLKRKGDRARRGLEEEYKFRICYHPFIAPYEKENGWLVWSFRKWIHMVAWDIYAETCCYTKKMFLTLTNDF